MDKKPKDSIESYNNDENLIAIDGNNKNLIKTKAQMEQNQQQSTDNSDNTNTDNLSDEELTQQKLSDYNKIASIINAASIEKDSLQNLAIDQLELVYYERKVRPLTEIINNLSIASFNIAAAANLYQGNAFQDKRDVKDALNLSIDIGCQLEIAVKLLDTRLQCFKNMMNGCEK